MTIRPQPSAIVIDDDKSLGEAFVQALILCGFNARHILHSTQAMTAIREERPDVVLMDMQMPKLNGGQLLALIRSDPELADLQVIIASANHLMLDQAVQSMATLVLQKRVSLSQITAFAQRLLTQRAIDTTTGETLR